MSKLLSYLATGINYLLIINLILLVEMILNAIIQHHDLHRYVPRNWKLPVVFSTLFAVIGSAIIFSYQNSNTSYVIGLFFIVAQSLIMLDYHRMLKRYIEDSWYLTSTEISLTLSTVCSLVIIAIIILGLAWIDFK